MVFASLRQASRRSRGADSRQASSSGAKDGMICALAMPLTFDEPAPQSDAAYPCGQFVARFFRASNISTTISVRNKNRSATPAPCRREPDRPPSVSLSCCAAASVCSQAAPLSASTQRMTVAMSRMSQAGVCAHSCRCSQPMPALCGANSLARAIKSSAEIAASGVVTVGLSLAARPENLSAAAVARESASARALRIFAACVLHVWIFAGAASRTACRRRASANAQFAQRDGAVRRDQCKYSANSA